MITLLTKDGKKSGNAIIIGGGTKNCLQDFVTYELFTIETDFGNRMNLTWKEIEEFYTIGRICSYEQWNSDREKKRQREPQHLINMSTGDWSYQYYPGSPN